MYIAKCNRPRDVRYNWHLRQTMLWVPPSLIQLNEAPNEQALCYGFELIQIR